MMVSVTEVQASNARIKSTFPSGLVAVFVGATAGIGETALKEFVRQASKPRIYFVGRSQEGGDRILSELKSLNAGGEYTFLRADTSLIRNVDDLCREIKAKETTVNVLCMSQGTLKFGTTTSEGLHYGMAVAHYARVRFMVNLLPLIQAAPGLRRVVNVGAGTHEGNVFPDDWQSYKVPMASHRGQMASMMTLAHLALARQAPDIAFVNTYPGYVKTGLIRGDEGLLVRIAGAAVVPLLALTGILHVVSHDETGQRHTYYCTSGRYPSREGGKDVAGVPLQSGERLAVGVDGKEGSGVYSVNWDGESAPQKVVDVVNKHVKDGMVDNLWQHTLAEFERITGEKGV